MKILVYGWIHHKNREGINLMCKAYNIDLEFTENFQRLLHADYEILLSTSSYFDPSKIDQKIKIIYGPHLWVFPEEGEILGPCIFDASKCVFNCLSDWVETLYNEFGSLKMPLKAFPFAVNVDQNIPVISASERDLVILYYKDRSTSVFNHVESLVKNMNLKYITFKYGSYNQTDYKNALQKAKFMIVIDRHESQGFALQDAMSCNVPLLVMDVKTMYEETGNGGASFTYERYKPNKELLATSVPYWSDECGIKCTEISEFNEKLSTMLETWESFTPRNYIVRTLSPKVCMKRILDHFGFLTYNSLES